ILFLQRLSKPLFPCILQRLGDAMRIEVLFVPSWWWTDRQIITLESEKEAMVVVTNRLWFFLCSPPIPPSAHRPPPCRSSSGICRPSCRSFCCPVSCAIR